jgi:hypothetical protein
MNRNAVIVRLWTDENVYAVNKRVAGWHLWTTTALPALQDMCRARCTGGIGPPLQ